MILRSCGLRSTCDANRRLTPSLLRGSLDRWSKESQFALKLLIVKWMLVVCIRRSLRVRLLCMFLRLRLASLSMTVGVGNWRVVTVLRIRLVRLLLLSRLAEMPIRV